MEPKAFLNVQSDIQEKLPSKDDVDPKNNPNSSTKLSHYDEAKCRTIISRSYYAVYLHARELLRKADAEPDQDESHTELQCRLKYGEKSLKEVQDVRIDLGADLLSRYAAAAISRSS